MEYDVYKALAVPQPDADLLTVATWRYGQECGSEKTSMVRSRSTRYRGDLLVCSTAKPDIPEKSCGTTCGLVELYEVEPTSKGYIWKFRNPRRVVEMPVKAKSGYHEIKVPKGSITEYPCAMQLGEDGWEIIKKQIH